MISKQENKTNSVISQELQPARLPLDYKSEWSCRGVQSEEEEGKEKREKEEEQEETKRDGRERKYQEYLGFRYVKRENNTIRMLFFLMCSSYYIPREVK